MLGKLVGFSRHELTNTKYGKSDVSAIVEHVWVDEHDVDIQFIPVLAWEADQHQRMALES